MASKFAQQCHKLRSRDCDKVGLKGKLPRSPTLWLTFSDLHFKLFHVYQDLKALLSLSKKRICTTTQFEIENLSSLGFKA